AISRAARKPKTPIVLSTSFRGEKTVLHVAAAPTGEPVYVYFAVTEDNLVTSVSRGENQGRKLSHVAVVRKLTLLGSVKTNVAFTTDAVIPLQPEWKRDNSQVVVFLQSSKTRAIIGAAEIRLTQ